MLRNSLTLPGIALCLVTALTACRSVLLADPPQTAGGATQEQSRTAIIRALGDLRYSVDEESPGRIRARLQRNAWAMIVDITYDKAIRIRYADSMGLDYAVENDVAYIHQSYNSRAAALQKEIQRQLTIVALENKGLPPASVGGGPPPAPPAQTPAPPAE